MAKVKVIDATKIFKEKQERAAANRWWQYKEEQFDLEAKVGVAIFGLYYLSNDNPNPKVKGPQSKHLYFSIDDLRLEAYKAVSNETLDFTCGWSVKEYMDKTGFYHLPICTYISEEPLFLSI